MTMTRLKATWLVFIMLPFLLAISLRYSRANSKENGLAEAGRVGVSTPVLVELFTSEGCSSCPPADALLAKLDRSQLMPGVQVVVIGEHVDYWDDIGWKDPYSSRQFSVRQSDYAHQFRIESPYTPQMVVDGSAQFVGSDERQAVRAIESAAKVDKLPITLALSHLEGANTVAVHIEAGPPASPRNLPSGQVWIALADDSDQTNVARGENAGRMLTHVAVVRSLTQIGILDRGVFSKDLKLSLENTNQRNLRVVAIVQEPATGRVLGVGSGRLAN
jgi:hypothetical protein